MIIDFDQTIWSFGQLKLEISFTIKWCALEIKQTKSTTTTTTTRIAKRNTLFTKLACQRHNSHTHARTHNIIIVILHATARYMDSGGYISLSFINVTNQFVLSHAQSTTERTEIIIIFISHTTSIPDVPYHSATDRPLCINCRRC